MAEYSRRQFIQKYIITPAAATVAVKLAGLGNLVSAQQSLPIIPTINPQTGPYYIPPNLELLVSGYGRQALENAITGGGRIGRANQRTTVMIPSTYPVNIIISPEARRELSRSRLNPEIDLIPSAQRIMNEYIAGTFGRIVLGEHSIQGGPVTTGDQLNSRGVNINFAVRGQWPFTGSDADAAGLNDSYINQRNQNLIDAIVISIRADALRVGPTAPSFYTPLKSFEGTFSQEFLEASLNSGDLKIPSDTEDPGTVTLFRPIPIAVFRHQFPLPIDKAVYSAVNSVQAGTSRQGFRQIYGIP